MSTRTLKVAVAAMCALSTVFAISVGAAWATNGSGGANCPNSTFSGFDPALPDCRAYELVSHTVGDQEVYSPNPGDAGEEDITTKLPYRASATGDDVAYVADPPADIQQGNGNTGNGGGNEYLATRGQGVWTSSDITPSNIGATYEAFSGDLSLGIVRAFYNPPGFAALTSEVSENGRLITCEILYSHSLGSAYYSLFKTTQTPEFCGHEKEPLFAGGNEGTNATPKDSHLLLQTMAALTPGTEQALGGGDANLYELVDGDLRSVNILAGKPDPNATFGAPAEPGEFSYNFSNAISADGSRIFWTDLNTERVYVRENGTTTVPVSAGPAKFWTATADGRYVYYTEGQKLWRDDLDAQPGAGREQIAGEGIARESAGVEGVVGVNEAGEEGAYVYFVATGRLADNENSHKEMAEVEQPNLYVHHGGITTFIATLSTNDNSYVGPENVHSFGDWQASLGHRTAELDANGDGLAFMSERSLTGYENILREEPVPEMFVYDADNRDLSCASCNPSGAPPAGGRHQGGAFVPYSFTNSYMPRWFSADGSRVFFDTVESLVPQDTNHKLSDVYEWERSDAGSCPAATVDAEPGCLSLLSGGSANDASYLVDASVDGSDVFFTSRARLAPQDENELVDVYDAHVDGGFPATSLACTGTGCQGIPPAPPIFATPSSVTFSGVGNFEQPAKAATKIRNKTRSKLKRCAKGSVRKHGRCIKRPDHAGKRSKRGKRR